jgi:hypothetical protein
LATSPSRIWGSTEAERSFRYPCDGYLADADDVYYRAVDVRASQPIVFRWLCQLKVAPYSYDWIDNRGRRSPRRLTPGIDELAVGQRVMSIFDLVEFEPDRHLTLVLRRLSPLLGMVAMTYLVQPSGERGSRLIVKLRVRSVEGRGGRLGAVLRRSMLPWGDLFMMRKQLLTLKQLSEQSEQENRTG